MNAHPLFAPGLARARGFGLRAAALLALAVLLLSPSGVSTSAPAGVATPDGGPAFLMAAPANPTSTLYHNLSWRQAGASNVANLGQGAGLAAIQRTGSAILFGGLATEPGKPSPVLVNATSRYWLSNNTWQSLDPKTAPSPRQDFAFAEDGLLDEDVLFGGETNLTTGVADNQTWLYFPGNDSWEGINTTVAPAPRQDAAFAVATFLAKAVLFGGWNQSAASGEIYGDTWYFNLTADNWTLVPPSSPEPTRLAGASMVWDNAEHRFDLFGGCYVGCGSSLWQFDPYNLTWKDIVTVNAPPPRELGSFSYDPEERVDVLFGGESGGNVLADTWEYSPFAQTWLLQSTPLAPPARYDAATTWLSVTQNQSFLVAGGSAGSGAPLTDVWLASPTGFVPVQTLSSTTDLPIPSATVTADGSFAAVTNAQGFGNASGVAPGSATVAASAAGYLSASQGLWLYPGTNHSLVILYLVPNPQGKLYVRVMRAPGAWPPISGADVNVTVGGVLVRDPPLTTNSRGYANYTNVPSEVTVVVSAWLVGYHASETSLVIPEQGSAYVELNLTSLPVLTIHAEGTNVVPPVGAYPFPGVDVLFNGSFYLMTGSGGWLNATFARGGPLSVEGAFTNYIAAWGNQTLPYSGHLWANLTLEDVFAPSAILVEVNSSATRHPLAGADVNVTYSEGTAGYQGVTNSTGGFRNSGLFSGPNYITVWEAGYYAVLDYQFLYPGEVFHLNVSLVPLPNLVLQVHGIPLSGPTLPLPGTLVTYNGVPGGTTGAHGFLNFTPARAGAVELIASHLLYELGYLNLTVNVTGTQWANMTLVHLPWANLSVQVRDRDDQLGIVGALVNVTLTGGPNVSLSGAHGFANFTDVEGPGHAGAQKAGFYETIGGVSLAAHATTRMVLDLVPYTTVHVRVWGENATAGPYPVSSVAVTYNGSLIGYTNPEGYLNDSSRPQGWVTLAVTQALYLAQSRKAVINYTGQLNETFILLEHPLATIDVRLLDAETLLGIPFGDVNATNLDPEPTTDGGDLVAARSGWANFTEDLGEGNYTLTGFQNGYRVETEPVDDLTWGETVVRTMDLLPNPYTSIYVEVLDKNTSAPIPGALVQFGPVEAFVYQATTDSAGNASFPLPYVPGGSYLMEVSAKGYWSYENYYPTDFDSGRHVSMTIYLKPAPPVNCTTGTPGCEPNPNGTTTKGSLSLLPFASGPYWPFLLLPPLFLMGALVLFMATRRPRQRPTRATVVVVPPGGAGTLPTSRAPGPP